MGARVGQRAAFGRSSRKVQSIPHQKVPSWARYARERQRVGRLIGSLQPYSLVKGEWNPSTLGPADMTSPEIQVLEVAPAFSVTRQLVTLMVSHQVADVSGSQTRHCVFSVMGIE